MKRRILALSGGCAIPVLVALGVFAANDWLPKTDPMTGVKTGWFGRELPKHATSAWNPFPPPSPTPQLSKEYIYAGSRLLAVEDANATAAPPADIAVWRPSNGHWFVMGQTGSASTEVQWGSSSDIPTPGDFDGDGKTDLGVARPDATAGQMNFYVSLSNGGYFNTQWGYNTDFPTAADFDGDGLADVAVYRESDGNLYVIRSSDLGYMSVHVNASTSGCNAPWKCMVSSDYDGDGKADPAVYNSSTGYWKIFQSTTNSVVSVQWGSSGDLPVQNDYDGDGKTDLAVYTPTASNSPWTIKRSSNGTTRTEYFGAATDIPVPAYYRR